MKLELQGQHPLGTLSMMLGRKFGPENLGVTIHGNVLGKGSTVQQLVVQVSARIP